jgi:hypothetical protein
MNREQIVHQAAERGYFSDRIRRYVEEHNPDLLENEDSERIVGGYTLEAIQLYLTFDRTGIPSYEAVERALTETLESISSPLGVLRIFVEEHTAILGHLTGQNEPGEPNALRLLLLQNRHLVEAVSTAPTEEEVKTARRNLFLGVMDTLRNQAFPQS